MPGIAGPPTVPPLPPLTTDDTRRRRSKRPGFDARDRWSWLAGAVFGIAAFAFVQQGHMGFAVAFWTGLSAFVTAAVLWHWLMPRQAGTVARCAVIGAVIGLLVPPLNWVLIGLNLLLIARYPLGQVLALEMPTLVPMVGTSVLIGALLGAALSALERGTRADQPGRTR